MAQHGQSAWNTVINSTDEGAEVTYSLLCLARQRALTDEKPAQARLIKSDDQAWQRSR